MALDSQLLGPLSRVLARRELVYELTKRDILGRYSGSFLGLFWSFATPLLMLLVYTVAFRELLGMRWPNAGSRADFSLMIFSGMIVHGLFAECISKSPQVIVGNVNLVKKVVFPLAVLPCVSVASALFHTLLSILVLLIFVISTQHGLYLTTLYLPVVLLPYLVLLTGVSWFMASLGVYFRDVAQLSNILSSIFMFLSPVFYPSDSLPSRYRSLMHLNPLTLIIEQTRAVVLFGQQPHWSSLGLYLAVALVVMSLGYVWFQRTREGFADVL
jgi:lipopolysaccharide transport system permease protein